MRFSARLIAAALLVPAISGGTYARQAGPKVEKKDEPKRDSSRDARLQALQAAIEEAGALKDARSRAQMLAAIAAVRARAGEQEAAGTTFQQAVRVADAIENPQYRVYTLQEIAAAQGDSGDRPAALATLRHASEVVDTIGDEFQRLTARSWIVSTFSRAGDVDSALRMALDLPDGQLLLKSRALSNVLEGLKPAGKPAMHQALPMLLKAAATVNSPEFEADCLRGFAEVLADVGDVENIRKIAEVLEKGAAEFGPFDARRFYVVHQEVFVLAALAKAQFRAGKRDAALETLKKAVELAGMMPPEGEGLRSDRLDKLARCRAEVGDFGGAVETVDLIVYEYHKAQALISIAEAEAKAGRREQPLALFRKAIEVAHEIKVRDPLRDRPGSFYLDTPECLRAIAFVQARVGFTAEAIRTAETIDSPRRKDSALGLVAMATARRGEIEAGVRLAGEIRDEKMKERTMQDIAAARAEAGDVQGALDWARSRTTPEARANALLGIMKVIARSPAPDG